LQITKAKPGTRSVPEISYSEFLTKVESGNVIKVTISHNQVNGRYRDNAEFRVIAPTSQEWMLQTLHQKNVEIWFADAPSGGGRQPGRTSRPSFCWQYFGSS